MLDKKHVNHIVAILSGVTEEDTKISGARKAVELMRKAGFPPSAIRKAEKMIEEAIARGVK